MLERELAMEEDLLERLTADVREIDLARFAVFISESSTMAFRVIFKVFQGKWRRLDCVGVGAIHGARFCFDQNALSHRESLIEIVKLRIMKVFTDRGKFVEIYRIVGDGS